MTQKLSKMINFDQIKQTIIEKGLATKDAAINANQKVIAVNGVWNRNGSARITNKAAGWVCDGLNKTVNAEFDVPEVTNFDEDAIKSGLAAVYPGVRIIINID